MNNKKIYDAWEKFCKKNGFLYQQPTLYWRDDVTVELSNINGLMATYNPETGKFTLPSSDEERSSY